MKQVASLFLALVLSIGLMGTSAAQAIRVGKSDPLFDATFVVDSDAVWAIKQDGSLWVWRGATAENQEVQWPVKASDNVTAINRDFPYGLLMEKQGELYVADRYSPSWIDQLSAPLLAPAHAETVAGTLAWYYDWDCGRARSWYMGSTLETGMQYVVGLTFQEDGSVWYIETTERVNEQGTPLSEIPWVSDGMISLDNVERKTQLFSGGAQSYHVTNCNDARNPEGTVLFVLQDDGTLWEWNFPNRFGRDVYEQPRKILDGIAWMQGDMDGVFALDTSGVLWDCFGGGYHARPGAFPRELLRDVTVFELDLHSRVAIRTDGSLWIWGRDGFGGGLGEYQEEPVHIMDDVAAVQVQDYMVALKNDGTLWVWGGGNYIPPSNLFPNQTDRTVPEKIMDGVMLPSALPINTPSSWAAEQVTAAIAAGIVPQHLQSRYTQAITRAEFCALAVLLYESVAGAAITERMTFHDTTDLNVQKMGGLGVVTGTGDGAFSPADPLTREQAAVMLSRLADAVGEPFPQQAAAFADEGSIAPWAIEQVGRVQGAAIMHGVDGNRFAPQSPYTREQSVATLLRLFNTVR